ncbi:MAG: 7-cyano-7-deazaguanine synthase QueC [Bdellovibrionota bacterium]|nr:7-cyano-7-deazaguanine synthase QueC [Deltaproteobacteria bacterium]
MSKHALVLYSGGQDSTTCLAWARQNFTYIEAMTFDYGQTHAIELACAKEICQHFDVPQKIVDMKFLQSLHHNALTDQSIDMHATSDMGNLPATFVPGRNALFLTIAAAYGIPKHIYHLIIGACEVDFSGYPDCRQIFIDGQAQTLSLAMDQKVHIHTPLMHKSKAEIFALADELACLDLIIKKSHTCYRGDRKNFHPWGYGCGNCPACILRKQGYATFESTKSKLL